MSSTVTFAQVLDLVDNLAIDEQEVLINVVHNRLLEKRRAEIADSITEAVQEYESNQVFRGNVTEIMAKLSK